jgi:hypothetical protein
LVQTDTVLPVNSRDYAISGEKSVNRGTKASETKKVDLSKVNNPVLRDVLEDIEKEKKEDERTWRAWYNWGNWFNWGNWGNWYNGW